MHVALVGPIAVADVRSLLSDVGAPLPVGYAGAPLTGIIIGELLKLGHRVTGITTDDSLPLNDGPIHFDGPGFTLVVCPARRRAWRPNGWRLGRIVDLFAYERRVLRDAIVQAKPDIVHAQWSYEFALAAIDQDTPHLITCHDLPSAVLRHTRSPYRALRYLMAMEVFRKGKNFTTVSDYMAQHLTPSLGQVPQVIPNPVAASALEAGRVRPLPATRRVAMVCNGWDGLKNPEPSLRAFAAWRQEHPNAELHLYGHEFGEGETAQRWAMHHGLSAGMHFHGSVGHVTLIEQLAAKDALLHPSLMESFGVVLAEAMALGLPVVAGRFSGAVPWVLGLDREDGCRSAVLVNVESACQIRKGLNELFDGEYEKRSQAGALRAAEFFSPQVIGASYAATYSRIIAAA